ncbi:MAG TPA: Fis family transcriptional regulator [Treponema sp.]|nr:MAG: hypothetical protein A2001_18880 [Treponema sp. GWC1_61_84]HCM25156.1 Fis family transcriptional regulator [Treponema sp.]
MNILLADDDGALRKELSVFLSLNGHTVVQASDLGEALRGLQAGGIDAVLADLYLGAENGMDILAATKLPVIVISGMGRISDAVAALRAGAWDFLEKPVAPDRLLGLLRNLDRGLSAERGMEALRDGWLAEHAVCAKGSAFERALLQAREAARSPLSVLISGESGTGKDIVARYIHFCSPRSAAPFVAVNCAAIPHELAESLLFGSVRGAYTGAEGDRPGWFQAADGGTLFLDELGEIPQAVQAKLLRAAESGEIQRLGSSATERVNVRIVSATNGDLAGRRDPRSFREDLYWRLAQIAIEVPPLRERRGDIGLLANFFLARMKGGALGDPPGLDGEGIEWLSRRDWPGNVRELRAFVERAAWSADKRLLGKTDLAALDGLASRIKPAPGGAGVAPQSGKSGDTDFIDSIRDETGRVGLSLRQAKLRFEKAYIDRAMEISGGSVAKAARALGLLPNNLSRKLRGLGDPED